MREGWPRELSRRPDSSNLASPFTLHPSPFTLHPSPFTLHPSPFTLHPSPFTLHPSPFTLHPSPFTLHPSPERDQRPADHLTLQECGQIKRGFGFECVDVRFAERFAASQVLQQQKLAGRERFELDGGVA